MNMKGFRGMGRTALLSAVLFSLFTLSIFMQSGEVQAVYGRIWPAYVVLNPSVRIYQANTATSSFNVTNLDTAAAEVFISPNNNLKDYVDISTPYLYLEPGQGTVVTFDIAVADALQHSGDIFVTFKDPAISYTYLVSLQISPVPAGYATNNLAPSAPTGLLPRADYCSRDVTVNWTPSTDADTATVVYHYELDNNNDFSTKLESGLVVGNSKTFRLEPGLYFWRIRAYDGKFYSAWAMSSFKVNDPLQCMDRIGQLESRVAQLESLTNSMKSALCTLGSFSFCGSTPQPCAGTDVSCGTPGLCQSCNALDGCYSGYYRDYSCSSQSCNYAQSCTETCCDALHGNANAFCSAGVCNAPPGGCTNECTSGAKRCLDANTKQTCGEYDADGCTEWGSNAACANGCLNGDCKPACKAVNETCAQSTECCSNNCAFVRTCTSYDLRGICNRYSYAWKCQ